MLHFEVQRKRGQRADHSNSVAAPSQFPSFVLVFNDDWNDYSYWTWFCLYYYDENGAQHKIGELKLMCRGKDNTFDALNKAFDGNIGKDYCSVGIDPSYYSNIYDHFKDNIYDHFKDNTPIKDLLLDNLRDCAFNPNIYEEFAEDNCFKTSLLREDSSLQAIYEAPYLLSGKDKTAAYSFHIRFSPEYLRGSFAEWHVKLLYDAPPFMRMVGLIGNNGVGKTQMLKTLVQSLICKDSTSQSKPMFRSCLAISSTPFDEYDKIEANPNIIPFHYFSVEQDSYRTKDKIQQCIYEIFDRPLIYQKSMAQLYKEALDEMLGKTIGNILEYTEDTDKYKLNEDVLQTQISIMSSGQLHIFNLLTFIYAHIKLTSLLVVDEPEVHLHPQIVVVFMAMLGKILKRFRSFAVIATHSPLVVREIIGENVYLMKTVDGDIPNVGKVPFETFGADASELYRNIFHYDEKMSSFYYYVNGFGESYDKTIKKILEYAPKLSLNARLSIRDYLEQREDA